VRLRPYQLQAIASLRTLLRTGLKRLVLVAPTGSGKTVIASEIIRSATARGSKVVFIAPRREIIDQTVDKLARFNVPAGVIMADDPRKADHLTQVCTVQTLARRATLPPAQIVILDEAHHALSDSYRKVLASYPDAIVLGLTATPWRTDRLGLADMFQGHVVAATPGQLIADGSLVNYLAYAYDAPDLHEVPVVAGDYQARGLELACNTKVLVGSVVREYLAHAAPRRALCFPVSIAHSQALTAEFQAAGVAAEHLDCKTRKDERRAILARLRTGETLVVSSVGVLVEGFDEPSAEVAILARPTKSLTLHLQMLGRVLRPAPGKERAIVHDHAGNLLRLGLPDDERSYDLLSTPKRVKELHTCPLCMAVFGALREGRCPNCGEAIAPVAEPVTAKKARRTSAEVEGERIAADEIRRRRAEAGLVIQQGATTGNRKADEFLRLCAEAESKGYKRNYAHVAFKARFGHWPRFDEEQLRRTA
jgi:DNA repair protein RadD